MALLLSVLSALAPAVVIAFLLYRPIISQFEGHAQPRMNTDEH
jgi:hypothetical protein